ncbi:AGC/NDR protein kinase [Gaeumannomyces tritici R3-111a-1]|uniref:non-specific serine/threonine protein kinase n=1 Tax=Gaeumannomyces tritici (strain R3-111a-1) TaxID=644352 RepID=J3NN25_GAET3|nr:AGC/NDR protein kinase [Gaeumannomyces tritici R3-111a-1]EJT77577.1 AGC/NDR protein kinase [Gaeumannomyces tritici R3-111a-1]
MGEEFPFQAAPGRCPTPYGPRVQANREKCSQLATEFFKNGVARARERHLRQERLNQQLANAEASPQKQSQLWSNTGKLEAQYLRFLRTPNTTNDYETIKLIGKGAFGEVKLVRRRQTGKVYALKSLLKSQTVTQLQEARVRAERDILVESNSPWVVKLYMTFQDASFLYMLMEFLPGGDLMTMLIKYEVFTEDITRFYVAEMVMAIEAVHDLGFIHRDIKPDNILLDRGGHVKLTDFGLSTGFRKTHDSSYYRQLLKSAAAGMAADEWGGGGSGGGEPDPDPRRRESVNLDQINMTVSNRGQINEWRRSRRAMAYSAVGTPDYIAPELIRGAGYTRSIDWWSLGAITYESLIGWAPFASEVARDTYVKISNWPQHLYFPDDVQMSRSAENLIRSLMCEPENRLGREGAAEIKKHSFFNGVDFEGLRRIAAPFKPHLTSETDTAHFPSEEELERNALQMTGAGPQSTAAAAAAAAAVAAAVAASDGGPTSPIADAPEMTLPFLGYTFKRFEDNLAGMH